MSKEWSNSILGCFSNPKLCIFGFCVPCYALGKNSESLGEECLLIGLLAMLGLNFGPVLRWRLRQERDIKGSMLMDVLVWTVIPCCALVQEAKEVGWNLPKELENAGKRSGTGAADAPEMNRE